jgi:hypothetical protein
MKLEVLLDPDTRMYKWKLWDGPDGIDEFSGASNSLGHVFDDVQNFRTLNALQYQLEERDLLNSTSKQPIQANKTVHD